MKSGFCNSGSFFGAVSAALVCLLGLLPSGSASFDGRGHKTYDVDVRVGSRTLLDRISMIAVDNASIASIGRWSWSREVHATMALPLAGGEQPTDILSVVPPGRIRFHDGAISKDADQRFQTGVKLAGFAESVGEATTSGGSVDISL